MQFLRYLFILFMPLVLIISYKITIEIYIFFLTDLVKILDSPFYSFILKLYNSTYNIILKLALKLYFSYIKALLNSVAYNIIKVSLKLNIMFLIPSSPYSFYLWIYVLLMNICIYYFDLETSFEKLYEFFDLQVNYILTFITTSIFIYNIYYENFILGLFLSINPGFYIMVVWWVTFFFCAANAETFANKPWMLFLIIFASVLITYWLYLKL